MAGAVEWIKDALQEVQEYVSMLGKTARAVVFTSTDGSARLSVAVARRINSVRS